MYDTLHGIAEQVTLLRTQLMSQRHAKDEIYCYEGMVAVALTLLKPRLHVLTLL